MLDLYDGMAGAGSVSPVLKTVSMPLWDGLLNCANRGSSFDSTIRLFRMFFIPRLLIPVILLCCSRLATSSPPQARAAPTTYVYMAATTVPAPSRTVLPSMSCPDGIFGSKGDCPSGCVAAPCAGALGININSWTCDVSTPATSWTSYKTTSTCDPGSLVTTYTRWGGHTQLGCKATAA